MKEKSSTCFVLAIVIALQIILVAGELHSIVFLEVPSIETFRDGKQYAFMLSWDDGSKDLEFSFPEDELGLRHTSFVVTERMFAKQLWGLDMLFRGHDIQSHSSKHLHHSQLNSTYREELLKQSVIDIQSVFGFTPILFAYPYGSQDYELQEQVLEYFQIARGIRYEEQDLLGEWPVSNPGHCKHSFPSIDGVRSTNMHQLATSFEMMISNSEGGYLAYKCYGHTQSGYFTEEEREEFFELLEEIANRDDTWYTTWGEAVAYEISKSNVIIYDFVSKTREVSFYTLIPEEVRYGVPLTYRIEIPEEWNDITVFDGNHITDQYSFKNIENKRYVFLNSAPKNQRISIVPEKVLDTSSPYITNLRAKISSEGIAFLADIYDQDSLVSDVNISVSCDEIYKFDNVQNPTFWSNSTYGRAVFTNRTQCYYVKFEATDASGNHAVESKCFYLSPPRILTDTPV